MLTEVDDPNNATEVSITLASFTHSDVFEKSTQRLPSSLIFEFKLCEYDEISAGPFPLKDSKFSSQSQIQFEYQYNSPDHAKHLAQFMLERDLFVEVFDDRTFHLGTIALPLHLLVRHGKQSRSLENISVDVIAPRVGCDGDVVNVQEGAVLPGVTVGAISISIGLKGKPLPFPVAPNSEPMAKPSVTKRHALNLLDANAELIRLSEKMDGAHSAREVLNVDYDKSINANSNRTLKKRQLAAVEAYSQQYRKEEDRVDSFLSLVRDITPEGPDHGERMLINAAHIVREKMKKHVIASHVASEISSSRVITVKPFVGQSVLVEVEVTNPVATSEAYLLESSHLGVSLVTCATEWDARRRGLGAVVLAGKEHLVRFDCLQKDQVAFQAHQTHVLPLLVEKRTTSKDRIAVSLVSATSQSVTMSFELNVIPLLQIDRRIIIPCRYDENVKCKFTYEPKITSGDKSLSIKLIDDTTNEVRSELAQSSSEDTSGAGIYELTINASFSEKSSKRHVYIAIGNDHFISECWKIIFETRTPLFETACLGKRMRKEIVVKGGNEDRVVRCHAMILSNRHLQNGGFASICQFEKSAFQLMSNRTNRLHVAFQLQAAGRWNVLLNCNDEETGELVHSFILSVQCHLPILSKVCHKPDFFSRGIQSIVFRPERNNFHMPIFQEYSIDAPFPGEVKHIKLPFTNCLAQMRAIEVSSSNELILLPQTPKLQLSKDETVYARFRVTWVDESHLTDRDKTDGIDVFLFTQDSSTKAEDCVRIRIKIPRRQL